MDARQRVMSLGKGLKVLAFLNRHGDSTVTEVSQAIRVPRTTAYRLLESLAAEGFLEKQTHCDFYRTTSKVHQLSSGFGQREMIVEVAKPLIEEFGRRVGWPVALATRRDCDMVVRVATDHDTSLAIDRYTIGFATPILYAPAGFCYLAHCGQAERDEILDQSRHGGMADRPFGHGEFLSFMLEQVRSKGFCNIRFPEYREGGVAVPLLVAGEIVGGIVVRYIKSAVTASQIETGYVPSMLDLARRIEAVAVEPTGASPAAPPRVVEQARQLAATR